MKKKIDAGAHYIVTQMFFDNQKFFDFQKKCLENKINVPIIPGLKPISTKKQLNVLPQRFYVDLPDDLIKSVIKCKNNDQIRQVGIEWCIEQSKELKKLEFLFYIIILWDVQITLNPSLNLSFKYIKFFLDIIIQEKIRDIDRLI